MDEEELKQQKNTEQDIQDSINGAKDGVNLAKSAATGNVVGAVKSTINLAKNKKFRRYLLKRIILKALKPVLTVLLVASLFLGVFNAIGNVIDDLLAGASGVVDAIKDFFGINNEDGSIEITSESVDTILNSISSMDISLQDLHLLGEYEEDASEEERQEAARIYIKKFFEAQVVTETLNYNKGQSGNKTYGAVYVYRVDDEESTTDQNKQQLTYMPYEELQEFTTRTDVGAAEEARRYFSIDEAGNLVYVSTGVTTVEKGESTGDLSQESQTVTISLRTLNYKSAITQYTTQMNFLIYLTMVSQNPEFVSAVTDLIKDSRIEITIMDSVSTNVNTETYTYVEYTRSEYDYEDEDGTQHTGYETTHENKIEITRTTTVTYSPVVKVTYAKTWFSEQTIEYNKVTREPVIVNSVSSADNDESLADEEPLTGDETGTWITNQVKNYNDTTTSIVYEEGVKGEVDYSRLGQQGDAERYRNGEITEPTFVGLMETEFRIPYSTRTDVAGSNLTSGAEILFFLLQNDSKLEPMEEIMRYALYLYSGGERDYGVTELDDSLFEIRDFVQYSGGSDSLLKEYIRSWENQGGAPTNADGTKYIIEDDGAGHPTVGYGIDIFNGSYASLFIEAGYSTEIGAEVDIEFVDALEEQEINSNLSSIKSITSGLDLTEYQIHALVSRAYNCGVSGALSTQRGSPKMNFVDSYNTYWNEEDDQFEEQNNNADFDHSLYVQYMSKPTTSDGEYMVGLENRRKSEWTLFQTGYYDRIDKWYSEGGSIVECAKMIHQYMEQNNYTYCVYGGNSYEECGEFGKSHGLNATFEQSKTGYKNTCCATFVSWVLIEAGYLDESESQNGANNLSSLLEEKGWTVITDESELQPGDILSYPSHVEIYAGDNKIYNAGSGDSIRNASPSNRGRSFVKAYRAPY